MKRSAIKARREKVSQYLVKGTPEARIAELLGVGRATVARDVCHIKNNAREWLDDLARDGFIHEYRLALEKLRDHESELQKMLQKASLAQKIQIFRALDENVRLYLELLGETPTVHAYRRALRKLEVSKRKLDIQ
jgi:transposase